ncbi:TPA: hypothetical protein EYP44_02640 [Candidatus Bathyarchaeota archaeon]|nr:hypothetical protein [Candidatus Bathyarchaeota archaeon]
MWKKRVREGYKMMTKEEVLSESEDVLRELVQYAEEGDVTLLLEPLSHLETRVGDLEDLLWVLDGIGSPNIG